MVMSEMNCHSRRCCMMGPMYGQSVTSVVPMPATVVRARNMANQFVGLLTSGTGRPGRYRATQFLTDSAVGALMFIVSMGMCISYRKGTHPEVKSNRTGSVLATANSPVEGWKSMRTGAVCRPS